MPFPQTNQPEVKEYSKTHLRAILCNPNIDTSNEDALNSTKYKLSNKRFYEKVHPVIETHCKKIIDLPTFKKIRKVPVPVVKVIFEKLL